MQGVVELPEAVGIWCLFVCAAFACRLYCKGAIEARAGEWRSHLLYVVMTCVAVFLLGSLFLIDYPYKRIDTMLWLGGLWLVLSIAFEMFLGRYLLGLLWSQVFRDYNLLQGRLYLLVLLTVFFTPLGGYYLFF